MPKKIGLSPRVLIPAANEQYVSSCSGPPPMTPPLSLELPFKPLITTINNDDEKKPNSILLYILTGLAFLGSTVFLHNRTRKIII